MIGLNDSAPKIRRNFPARLRRYIRRTLLALQAAAISLFASSAPALADLHRAAEGLPRRLNRLADLALLVAYAEGLDRPDARAVEVAVRESAFEAIGA